MNEALASLRSRWPDSKWLGRLCRLAGKKMREHPHGDLPKWRAALQALPETETGAELDCPAPELGKALRNRSGLRRQLMALHPWRKGPLRLGGLKIDTEWRSDWKWDRVAPHIDLAGQRVLDIGCGNGYFGLRMLGAGAKLVVGIDPTLIFVMQWLACRHFSGDIPNYVLPLGVEDLPGTQAAEPAGFDTVFSMGVLYHRKDPHHHLRRIRSLLADGGSMVLETLVLPKGREDDLLVPEGRYARMRNVWGVPGTARLESWVEEAGFSRHAIVDITPSTVLEQRHTEWMQFESLEKALDPQDGSRTIEGHPAPLRAIVVAQVL